jgi:hypothetical protein
MRELRSSHTLACDPDTFWKVFLDPAYTKKLYLEELGFKELEIQEQTETKRRLRGVPKLNMPGPVMKLLGDRFGFVEDGTFDRAKNEWRWKLTTNTMSDKLFTSGIVRIEPLDGGRCRRNDEVKLEAKVFGIGGLIESSTEKELQNAWKREYAFLDRWLREQSG